jgi:SAM-dependent methyltransferase
VPQNIFDARIASQYDEQSADMFEPAVLEPTVAFLAERAGDGPALEFAIGTGRIALPLSRRGITVHGIDISEPMVARLREKEGADAVGVTIGDFATTRVEGTFRVVYLVFNTIMNLMTQDEQVACFENAAAHLGSGGCFVIEVGVPDLQRLPRGQTFQPFSVTPTHLGFDEYDVATQFAASHHYWIDGERVQVDSYPFRYVWPSELDLMARIAGLRLRERWGWWNRQPFTSESTTHVSVWEKPS